ncbi:MAG: TetR/AcrR family transcriptional regulator [Myxococcota bacterium]
MVCLHPKYQTARSKLLDASLALIREQGFSAMTVDDLCERAGVTKAAFFHYFKTKEELGVAAAEHWSAVTGALFAQADYHDLEDPLDRVLANVALRRALVQGTLPEFTCVVGTMAQETYREHPSIRDACAASIFGHADTLIADIQDAMDLYGTTGHWTAESLAHHTQAVIQGGFMEPTRDFFRQHDVPPSVVMLLTDHSFDHHRFLLPGRRHLRRHLPG